MPHAKHPYRMISAPIIAVIIVPIIALCLAGCGSTNRISGAIPAPEKIAKIEFGVSDRNDVQRLFGTPSITPLFDQQYWYYNRKVTDHIAFFSSIVQEHVLAVRFNDDGKVAQLILLDEKDHRAIDLATRTTPSHGIRTTVWDQLFRSYSTISPTSGSGQ